MGLTEHMPRTGLEDLYPEELDDPQASLAALMPRHAAYLAEAQRLQSKYADQIHILIGFEGEFIRPEVYTTLVQELATHPAIDYFIGSLHHTCGIPIDFDKAMWGQARELAGGTEDALYARYYDEQHAMLTSLKPRMVGHFDLIRLMSDAPERDLRGTEVWEKIVRNLEVVRGYDGWLECNSAASRKGLAAPYPARPIAEAWLRMGGKFTMSDDSHGIAQIATHYGVALEYLESLGVKEVWTLRKGEKGVEEVSVTLDEFRGCLGEEPGYKEHMRLKEENGNAV